jgi:O-antigen/teichoic acid export membrane protein
MTTSVQSRLLAEGIGYTVVDALQQAVALAATPFLLLLIDPAEFGAVTWGLVWMQVALAGGTLGLDFALLRHYERIPAAERAGASVRVLTMSTACVVVCAVIIAAADAVVDAEPLTSHMIWSGAAIGLLLAVRGVPLAVLRARREVRRYGMLMLGGALLQAAGQIAGAVVRPDAVGYMTGYAAATGAGLIWALALTRREFAWPEFGRWPDASLVRYAMAVLPSALFNRVTASADRFALFQVQDLATLGAYGLAGRLSLPLKMLSGGFRTALAPALGRTEDRPDELAAVLLSFGGFVTRLLVGGSALLLLGLELLAFTPWRGATAAEVEALLAVLLVAQAAGAHAALLQTAVYYSPRPGRAGWAGGVSAAVLLGDIVWLVPRHGAMGAAYAQVLAAWVALGLQASWLPGVPGVRARAAGWALLGTLPVVVLTLGAIAGPRVLLWSKILFALLAAGALVPDLRRVRGFLPPTSR